MIFSITTGTSATTFSPDDTVTRGQLAAFFYRYKDSPAVEVDPDHPAIPACAAQVPGPATTGDLLIDKDTTLIQNHTDGNIYFTYRRGEKDYGEWPFDRPHHLILNLAVGGWGGQDGVDENAFPARMEVDYVRVYQKTDTA